VFGFGIGAHPTLNPLARHLQGEQSKVDRRKRRIQGGEVNRKIESRVKTDADIKDLVSNFAKYNDKLEFMDLLEIQLQKDPDFVITGNAVETIKGVAKKYL
jgi:hypothetical protein